jgi:hypothetical protein
VRHERVDASQAHSGAAHALDAATAAQRSSANVHVHCELGLLAPLRSSTWQRPSDDALHTLKPSVPHERTQLVPQRGACSHPAGHGGARAEHCTHDGGLPLAPPCDQKHFSLSESGGVVQSALLARDEQGKTEQVPAVKRHSWSATQAASDADEHCSAACAAKIGAAAESTASTTTTSARHIRSGHTCPRRSCCGKARTQIGWDAQ